MRRRVYEDHEGSSPRCRRMLSRDCMAGKNALKKEQVLARLARRLRILLALSPLSFYPFSSVDAHIQCTNSPLPAGARPCLAIPIALTHHVLRRKANCSKLFRSMNLSSNIQTYQSSPPSPQFPDHPSPCYRDVEHQPPVHTWPPFATSTAQTRRSLIAWSQFKAISAIMVDGSIGAACRFSPACNRVVRAGWVVGT